MADSYVTTGDGVRLFVRSIGEGPEVVVLPNGHYLHKDFEPLIKQRRLIFYDLRNRGRSDSITDQENLCRGIHHDIDDLEQVTDAVCGKSRVALIAHSYVSLIAALYAIKYQNRLSRAVLIGGMAPTPTQEYPSSLTNIDATLHNALAAVANLQKNRQDFGAEEFCEQIWKLLRPIYVADPSFAIKIEWSNCDLQNERSFMRYWIRYIYPSLQELDLTAEKLRLISIPILLVHGKMDRSAPYGGSRDWALRLPNARLLTLENVAHAPWIEARQYTFSCLDEFLRGHWPCDAEIVRDVT